MSSKKDELLKALDLEAREAVSRSITEDGLILFSGGVDSSILATLIARQSLDNNHWQLYTLGLGESSDILQSKLVISRNLAYSRLRRIVKQVDKEGVLEGAKKTMDLVSSMNISQFEDCLAFYLLCKEIEIEVPKANLFTANGPDELFCGYDRFRRMVNEDGYTAAELEIEKALHSAKLLTERVELIGRHFGMTIRQPFLDSKFVSFSLEIPIQLKINRKDDLLRKRVWRDYGRYLGLPSETALRPKKAMQYSMGIHKVISSILRSGELKVDFSHNPARSKLLS